MADQTVASLAVMITARTDGLTKGLELSKRELREVEKLKTSAMSPEQRIDKRTDQLAAYVASGRLTAEAAAVDLLKLQRSLGVTSDASEAAARRLARASEAMGAMRTAAGLAAAGVAAIGTVVMSQVRSIDDLGDAAARLSVDAASLSTIRTAAFLGDVDPGAVDGIVSKMLVNIGKGGDAFARLKLDAEELAAKGPAAAFRDIASAIGELPTKAERMSTITEIFGKSGPEAASLVERFRELESSAIASGAVVPNELAERVGQIDDNFKSIVASAEGWKNTMTDAAAGPMKGFTDFLALAIKRPSLAMKLTFGAGGSDFEDWLMSLEGGRDKLASEAAKDVAEARIDEVALLDEEVAASEKQEKSIAKQLEAQGKLLDVARERGQILDMQSGSAEDIAAREAEFAAAKAGMDGAMQEQLAAQARLNSLKEQQLRWDKEIATMMSRNAIKEIEAGERIADSLLTPKESIEKRLRDDMDALDRSGMATDELRGRLIGRAAKDMLAIGSGGGFGAPNADKGTRAAREAVIAAETQQSQLAELKRIAASLGLLVAKPPVEVKELHE